MKGQMSIKPANGEISVLFKGRVVAKSQEAVVLTEDDLPAVFYLPRASLIAARLEAYARRSHCPVKGQASYYTLVTPEGRAERAVMSYEAPYEEAVLIARLIAFDPERVDKIVFQPF